MTITVIIPATNLPPTLTRALDAIAIAEAPPEQLLVIEDSSLTHPALARNAGAHDATGDLLVFIDADVTVHPDVFVRIRRAFAADPSLVALFGSYDDTPDAPSVVSRFRNLLHHYVHQQNPGPATTFWAGLGAIRRTAFEAAGGFSVHPIEDIELGIRLTASGARIILDPRIQGTHLKAWNLVSMVRTDLLVRGIPWVRLLLEYRDSASTSALNLSWSHRLSALASLGIAGAIILGWWWVAVAALALLIALNVPFYRFLTSRLGILRLPAGIGLHVVHHLTSVAAVPLGLWQHLRRSDAATARTTISP
ncbi:MAG: glycosyltransferase family 2 protein [Gemmatimonadota bacterium]